MSEFVCLCVLFSLAYKCKPMRSISNVKLLPSVYLFNIFINFFFSPVLSKILALFILLCFVCVDVRVQMGVCTTVCVGDGDVCVEIALFFPFYNSPFFFFSHPSNFFLFHIYYRICTRYLCKCMVENRDEHKTSEIWNKAREIEKKCFFLENSMPNRQIHINITQCQFDIQAFRQEANRETKKSM